VTQRYLALALALVSLVLWLWWVDHHKERWRYALTPILYSMFELGFWAYFFFGKATGTFDPLTANFISLAEKYYVVLASIATAIVLIRNEIQKHEL
jgi:hypothetical protein